MLISACADATTRPSVDVRGAGVPRARPSTASLSVYAPRPASSASKLLGDAGDHHVSHYGVKDGGFSDDDHARVLRVCERQTVRLPVLRATYSLRSSTSPRCVVHMNRSSRTLSRAEASPSASACARACAASSTWFSSLTLVSCHAFVADAWSARNSAGVGVQVAGGGSVRRPANSSRLLARPTVGESEGACGRIRARRGACGLPFQILPWR